MNLSRTYKAMAQGNDPWENLALEEYMVNTIGKGEVLFYLWQNQHTVVIGRNQNAWKECHIDRLESEGGKLARRLSGGGAVYHDLGNLNFSFIMDRQLYDLDRQLSLICNVVQSLGIDAKRSGRNDILVEGKKFSGNAFYFRPGVALHHGTLLVHTDLTRVQRYLNVSNQKLQSKGVQSVRSRVVNLQELQPSLSVEELQHALMAEFDREYNFRAIPWQDADPVGGPEHRQKLTEKYAGESWRYGKSPDCNVRFGKRFDWGEIEFNLDVKKGKIEQAMVFSDSLEPDCVDRLNQVLPGAFLGAKELGGLVEELQRSDPHPLFEDILEYLRQSPWHG
ncbi:MAG TPA: lipoate--protein ligase [Thermotogota bacterium]|nr:lipoate--protein ligase [Thermotogota bacterium]HRW91971.1 lipoate--protein ligase [Thermotogota bacterium]